MNRNNFLYFTRATHILESGMNQAIINRITQKFANKYTKRSECLQKNLNEKNEEEMDVNSMDVRLQNFEFTFMMFIGAVLFSFVVFLFEIIKQKFNK